MSIPTNARDMLAKQPLFAAMAPAQLQWLLSVGETVKLPKGQTLFRRGELCGRLFVLLEGYVKLAIPSDKGQEKVLEFFSPGDAFGESALLAGHCAIADAQALENCVLLALHSEDVMTAISKAPGFAQQLVTNLSQRVESLFRDMESVSLRSASQRVAEYLLRQPRVGNQARLPFHKRAIASKLGLQPETFSRSLQQLAADGLISVRGARIVIHNTEKLQATLA